jgi:hypothetical protein
MASFRAVACSVRKLVGAGDAVEKATGFLRNRERKRVGLSGGTEASRISMPVCDPLGQRQRARSE